MGLQKQKCDQGKMQQHSHKHFIFDDATYARLLTKLSLYLSVSNFMG